MDETTGTSSVVSDKSECAGWALLVNPDYVQGRGQWSRPNHKGYTMDWKQAGRFSRVEAQDAERRSSGKYTAIPMRPNPSISLNERSER